MSIILNQMLEKYEIRNIQDETNAMKEIIQEIVRILEIDCDRAEVLFGEYNEKH